MAELKRREKNHAVIPFPSCHACRVRLDFCRAWRDLDEGAVPQGSPGLVRRALLKLVGLAERDTRGQGSGAGSDLSAPRCSHVRDRSAAQ